MSSSKFQSLIHFTLYKANAVMRDVAEGKIPLKLSPCEKLIKLSEELVFLNDTVRLKTKDQTGIDPSGELELLYRSYSPEELSDEVIYLCSQIDDIINHLKGEANAE